MAYSKDFRQKALSIREERGLSLLETAELLGVGVASLFRWTKNPEPSKTRNIRTVDNCDMEALARDVEEISDDFQYERATRLGVSESCVGRALKRLKVCRKKEFSPP
jgi:transcriptional regulator with XRE-family HTH domain